MKFYNDYYNIIKSAMRQNEVREFSFDGQTSEGKNLIKAFLNESIDNSLLPSLETFANQIGRTPNFNVQLGSHPDFKHLKGTNETEKHYIVTLFIDIVGSTNLHGKYTDEEIFIITKTIQRAAIHTCMVFGGYIHRLQGDGLMVYFGGKSVKVRDAVNNALLASSMFTYFVKHDLKDLFQEQDIEQIRTRTGIDLGEDALWSMAGVGEISEVTTCNLHTNLASKMQSEAEPNGIVVGANIKETSKADHFTVASIRTGKEKDRYAIRIPNKNFNYTQYDFNWFNFLKEQDFIVTDLNGNLLLKHKPSYHVDTGSLRIIASQSTPYLSK